MRKLLLVGIDGMDPYLIDKWKDELPNMNKLKLYYTKSIFPPDSIPAWITIFTGKNPAEHGIIESIDYLNIQKKEFNIIESSYKGKTFWDYLSQKGKKVCIINPFLAYPPWKVNGVMVSGQVFIDGKNSSFPKKFLEKFPAPPLGGIEDFPDDNHLSKFIEKTKKDTKELAEYSIKFINNIEWDLFFITFLTLDRFKHFLWRYTDKKDITYPGKNRFESGIKEMYKIFDLIIGKYFKKINKNTKVMIISDHGHRRRCQHCFNVNELLRKKNYLKLNKKTKFLSYKLIEIIKNLVLRIMYKYNLTDFVIKLSKYIPYKKNLQKSSYLIDKEKSLAYASDFAGTNPFGGIILNEKRIFSKGLGYNKVKNQIIKLLKDYKYNGKKVVKWIKPREQVMKGKYINKFPELLVQLGEDFGFNWTLFNKIISINPTHKKISGGHKEEGVLLTNLKIKRDIKISDFYKIIKKVFKG